MAYKQKIYSGNGSTKGYKYAVGQNNATNAQGGSGRYSPGGTGRNASTGNTTKTTTSTNTSSSSSSSSGKSSSSGGSSSSSSGNIGYQGSDWDYSGLQKAYMNTLENRAAKAYERSMGLVNDYYDSAKENLEKNYDESVGILDRNNARNTQNINSDAEKAMRQAYINNMLSRKSLQQAMTAQGLNGGATETTRASMENNYGNARNAIDTTRNDNLADLALQYENSLAGLRQQLNNGLSDLDDRRMSYSMQINDKLQDMLSDYDERLNEYLAEAANSDNPMNAMNGAKIVEGWAEGLDKYNGGESASGIGKVTNDYLSNLQALAANSAYYDAIPAEATNYYDPTSLEQAGQYANSNYARLLEAQQALGASNTGASNTTLSNTGNVSSLAQILRALYGV